MRACRECSEVLPPDTNTRRKVCVECVRKRRARQSNERRKRNQLAITGTELWHGTTNGYTNHRCRCNECRTAYMAYANEWRVRPDVAQHRRDRARELSRAPHRALQKRAYNYGITTAELEALLSRGSCDACGSPCGPKELNVDHDHTCCADSRACGKCIRGVLCRRCNLALGAAGDDSMRLRLLADYLEGQS